METSSDTEQRPPAYPLLRIMGSNAFLLSVIYLMVGITVEAVRRVYPTRFIQRLSLSLDSLPARALEFTGWMEPLRAKYLNGQIPDYQVRLSGSHLNIGNILYARGQYEEALSLYRLALPAAVRAALDTDNINAQYTRGLVETKLAQALMKTGRIEEARALLLASGKILGTVLERDGSLRTEYAVGLNAVRLGELYAQLAETSRNGREAQLGLWREAQVSLRRGVASLQKVSDNAALQAIDKAPLRDGAAALARANSALAELQARIDDPN